VGKHGLHFSLLQQALQAALLNRLGSCARVAHLATTASTRLDAPGAQQKIGWGPDNMACVWGSLPQDVVIVGDWVGVL